MVSLLTRLSAPRLRRRARSSPRGELASFPTPLMHLSTAQRSRWPVSPAPPPPPPSPHGALMPRSSEKPAPLWWPLLMAAPMIRNRKPMEQRHELGLEKKIGIQSCRGELDQGFLLWRGLSRPKNVHKQGHNRRV